MNLLSAERIVLRDFNKDDFSDLLALSIRFKSAPGPECDKWPIDEKGCKDFLEYLCAHKINELMRFGDQEHHFCAVYLRDEEKVIGLLAINPINEYFLENKKIDLGHVIHSDYQNNSIDREAIGMIVEFIFSTMSDVKSITTGNYPNEEQIRPLKSLGFIKDDKNDCIYNLEKTNWEKDKEIPLENNL